MELIVQKREILGKKVSTLRAGGLIPAELYGRDRKNIHLSVPSKEFIQVFKEAGESTIVNLILGNEKLPVLVNDVVINPLDDTVMHIDFYQVRMDEKITASIPLEFMGEAPAVKEKIGVLVKAMQEVEVEALPADLPHDFKIDLGGLTDVGMSIYVRDIKVPERVKLLVEPETVIATVIEQAKEEEVIKPISVEEVKVEGEEKRKEAEVGAGVKEPKGVTGTEKKSE